jgi:PAS domain S-box-containing protein
MPTDETPPPTDVETASVEDRPPVGTASPYAGTAAPQTQETLLPTYTEAGSPASPTDALLEAAAEVLLPDLAIRLFQDSPDAIVVVDLTRKGTIVLVNRQAELMFGYHRSELLHQPMEMLLPRALRERHEAWRALYEDDPRTRPMGLGPLGIRLDVVAQRKNGTIIEVDVNLSPMVRPAGLWVIATIRRRHTAKDPQAPDG